ncbi:MAG: L-aspartate oxidase [Candidatus Methylacidiphilales bacterium]|nr:L-aspartate oxidase [Candidatus Methylacidiphilales bacterium]
MNARSFETIVLGSGIAGLTFALKAARRGPVAIITKKSRAESNTNYAQGGIACVTSQEDTFEMHVRDTLEAGAGLCHEEVVRRIVSEGPERIQELIGYGVRFSERENARSGELDLGKEGGHSKRRVLHAADMTGREIERALLQAIDLDPNIQIFENLVAVDLVTSGKAGLPGPQRCLGVYALDRAAQQVVVLSARVVVLATGGCGKSYLYTTNPDIATGDGVAMAFRAGVPVANMEMIQFHPTCLYHPFAKSFLISEALRGEGAVLVDAEGRGFMQHYDNRGSLAPRDIVARAIDAEMKKTGAACMYLDITGKPASFIRQRFPNIHEFCLKLGIDMTTQPVPVVPAAHYQCGGVMTDVDGATALPGLFAVGEVACTGLHGANRLASNSLLEAVVVSHRASVRADREAGAMPPPGDLPAWSEGEAGHPDELVVVTHNWKEIRQLMWDYVGIVRTDKRLRRAEARLAFLQREITDYYWDFRLTPDLIELRNLALVASIIVASALRRRESRGLHYTLDYPQLLPEARDTVLSRQGDLPS